MPTATPRPRTAPRKQTPRRRAPRPAWDLPRLLRLLIPVLALVVIVGIVVNLVGGGDQMSKLARDRTPHWVDKQIIAINGSGRRGEKLSGVTDIAIHYVGNPGTTAQQNHDYYDQPDTTVSSHFLIGLDGEIIQCIPMDEKSSATNDRNLDTLSIEVCHPDATGQFTQASYDALVKLTAWLCDYCGIGRDHVIRHYDVTGKLCPGIKGWNLENGSNDKKWQTFKAQLSAEAKDNTPAPAPAPAPSGATTVNYAYKVTVSDLNIRKGPGTNYDSAGYTGKGIFTIVAEKGGWGKLKSGAGWISLNSKYGHKVSSGSTAPAAAPSTLKWAVTIPDLRIRKGPGTNYGWTGAYTGKGTFTIVEQKNGWGRLKSGAGWISLNTAYGHKA